MYGIYPGILPYHHQSEFSTETSPMVWGFCSWGGSPQSTLRSHIDSQSLLSLSSPHGSQAMFVTPFMPCGKRSNLEFCPYLICRTVLGALQDGLGTLLLGLDLFSPHSALTLIPIIPCGHQTNVTPRDSCTQRGYSGILPPTPGAGLGTEAAWINWGPSISCGASSVHPQISS